MYNSLINTCQAIAYQRLAELYMSYAGIMENHLEKQIAIVIQDAKNGCLENFVSQNFFFLQSEKSYQKYCYNKGLRGKDEKAPLQPEYFFNSYKLLIGQDLGFDLTGPKLYRRTKVILFNIAPAPIIH